jgi:hypothetical protein
VLCLLAGCTSVQSRGEPDRTQTTDLSVAMAPRPPVAGELRIGVEYLPPERGPLESEQEPERPRAEALHGSEERPQQPESRPDGRGRSLREEVETPHLWLMRSEDLAAVRDPLASQTLLFVHDVLGEDNRRIRREIGTPILGRRYFDLGAANLPTHGDEVQAEEEAEALDSYGPRLLQKPLRNLLRRLDVVRAVELEFEDFKSENVPLSQAYRESHPETRKWGRMTARVNANNLRDPLEVSFLASGFRVGSGQQNFRLGYERWLTEHLTLGIHSQCRYDQGKWTVRGDLTWYVSSHTSFQIVASDNLDFLDTTTIYSLFETPMDGSSGLLLHAVHLF